jgi:hypothetical protein
VTFLSAPIPGRLFGPCLALALANCAPAEVDPPVPGSGGAGGAVSGASGAGAAGASQGGGAGAASSAGTGGAVGGNGASGSAGSGASSGTAGALSGVSGAGSGGAQAGAGAGGVAGSSPAGGGGAGGANAGGAGAAGLGGTSQAGSGGSPESDRMAAEALDGFAILKPCVSSFRPSMNANNAGDCCCEELAANENQHLTEQFGGDPTVTYNVQVRIAGVAERYWYDGGVLDPISEIFYAGGLPTIHGPAPNTGLQPGQGACKVHPPETDGTFALPFTVPVEIRPTDGCYNGFNIFALTVSSPKKSYYLNSTTDFDNNDRQPHSVYKTDYTITIPIQGQAQLDFYTIDGDHHQVTNNGTMTVPDVTTAQPYNGNFLEFTVIDVTRAN